MSRNGVSDWVIQRASALLLAAYTLCILGFVLTNPGLDYDAWRGWFNNGFIKVFTVLTLVSFCAHAWVGMWTIGSDYLGERTLGPKATILRFIYQGVCLLLILVYLLWGIQILWGVGA